MDDHYLTPATCETTGYPLCYARNGTESTDGTDKDKIAF